MVLFALLIPLVLVPAAAYSVEIGYAAARAALLQWACSRAAEDAAQRIDVGALRGSAVLEVDPVAGRAVAAAQLLSIDPRAVLDTFTASGREVAVSAHEVVPATLAFWIPGGALRVGGSARARLTPGYGSPSSLRPFSTSSFWVASSERPSSPSSSRQREGWMNG